MKRRLAKLALAATLFGLSCPGYAQFNTITKKELTGYEILPKSHKQKSNVNQLDTLQSQPISVIDTIPVSIADTPPKPTKKQRVRKKHLEYALQEAPLRERVTDYDTERLPELTISNLLKEIRKNGIQHEKVVLAQAILETGWFTSSVCRNKNNLFGLTNPRTKQYYEFRHWTESVRAYYTKVQYRYKGGNYLMWLDRIGYAEDPRYVSSLIKILKQYMM